MNSVIAQLAATDIDDFEVVLYDVFAQVGSVLDVLAMGESTSTGDGVIWFDKSRVLLDEVKSGGAVLRRAPDSSGPFSIQLPNRRVAIAAPASSNGFSSFSARWLVRPGRE